MSDEAEEHLMVPISPVSGLVNFAIVDTGVSLPQGQLGRSPAVNPVSVTPTPVPEMVTPAAGVPETLAPIPYAPKQDRN